MRASDALEAGGYVVISLEISNSFRGVKREELEAAFEYNSKDVGEDTRLNDGKRKAGCCGSSINWAVLAAEGKR